MSQTAYIKLKGVQGREVVSYDIGPVFIDIEDMNLGWYRNSFRPQPIGATGLSQVQIGEGQSAQFAGGSFAYGGSGVSALEIAVPDEMKSTPIAPRMLQLDKTFMVFYGASGTPLPATQATNTLTVGTGHGLRNGQLVTVTTTDTLPAGLEVETLYYVVGRTATAVSLALTPGGSVITLSSAGTGTHRVVPFKMTGFFHMSDEPNFSNEEPLGLL
jgi:hypothetical protein